MKDKKNLFIIITLAIIFLLTLVAGILMVYFDIQIGQKISEQAALCISGTITQETFNTYLDSQTPIRFALTLGGIVTLVVSVTFLVFFIKKLSVFIKSRHKADY